MLFFLQRQIALFGLHLPGRRPLGCGVIKAHQPGAAHRGQYLVFALGKLLAHAPVLDQDDQAIGAASYLAHPAGGPRICIDQRIVNSQLVAVLAQQADDLKRRAFAAVG
jgi:hypothetical protein